MAFSDSDFPPPPVTQPTLPPPAMDDDDTVRVDAITGSPAHIDKLRAWARRRDAQLGAAAVVAIAMIGGYAGFSPKGPEVGHATTNEAHNTLDGPDDLIARIDSVMSNLAPATLDQPCSQLNARTPLVFYASVEDRATNKAPSATEGALFATAMPLSALDQETAKSQHVAILRTLTLKEPHASVGHPAGGRYEGDLVVLDTSSGARLCHTRIVAWSSSIADEPSISERVLRDDFTSRVRTAASEAGARLHVNLEL